MDNTLAEKLVQESIGQLRMRPGLEDLPFKQDNFTEILINLDTPENPIHPLIELPFSHSNYKVERKRAIDHDYTLILRAVILNSLAKDEKKEDLTGIDNLASKYMAKKGGSFSSNWEYHLLVYHKPQIRNLLGELAKKGNPLALLYCINHKKLINNKIIYESRNPAIIIPGATNEEIETIMKVESERNKQPGYLHHELPYKHYDKRRRGLF